MRSHLLLVTKLIYFITNLFGCESWCFIFWCSSEVAQIIIRDAEEVFYKISLIVIFNPSIIAKLDEVFANDGRYSPTCLQILDGIVDCK